MEPARAAASDAGSARSGLGRAPGTTFGAAVLVGRARTSGACSPAHEECAAGRDAATACAARPDARASAGAGRPPAARRGAACAEAGGTFTGRVVVGQGVRRRGRRASAVVGNLPPRQPRRAGQIPGVNVPAAGAGADAPFSTASQRISAMSCTRTSSSLPSPFTPSSNIT